MTMQLAYLDFPDTIFLSFHLYKKGETCYSNLKISFQCYTDQLGKA